MDVFVCTGMLTFTCIQHSHLDVCMIPTNKWPEGLTRKDVNLNDLGWLSRSEPCLAAAQSVPSSSAGLNWNHWAAADTHVCADVVQFGTCLILAYLSGTSLLPYQASPLARSQQGFFFLMRYQLRRFLWWSSLQMFSASVISISYACVLSCSPACHDIVS